MISISRTSTTCVRFDRHAVYLGDPGQNQDCPSGLLGTTEAILAQPGGRGRGGAVSLYGTGTEGRQYADRQAAAFGAFGGWVVI